jgi:hypothetical protein
MNESKLAYGQPDRLYSSDNLLRGMTGMIRLGRSGFDRGTARGLPVTNSRYQIGSLGSDCLLGLKSLLPLSRPVARVGPRHSATLHDFEGYC